MRGLLVRVGIDQAYGRWNAPVDPGDGGFVYVPIPEGPHTRFHPKLDRRFPEFVPAVSDFCGRLGLHLHDDLRFPRQLLTCPMHLDPDFEHRTYGDDGSRRGAGLRTLAEGDLVAFYAGLRPITHCEHRLLYALIGLYVVEEVVPIHAVAKKNWCKNAHTRRSNAGAGDVIVRAKKGVSGRLDRCIPVGEWRAGAYRVRRDILKAWGGLSVKDGFIQRSAVAGRCGRVASTTSSATPTICGISRALDRPFFGPLNA